MLCQKCNENEATVYITQVINSKVTKRYLCEKCAKEEANLYSGGDLFSFLSGLMNIESNMFNSSNSTEILKCPLCGSTLEEIMSKGKVGCEECYNVFANQLEPLIKRIHGTIQHKKEDVEENIFKSGKLEINNEIRKLKIDLKKAIKEERYEDAAEIRDKIKAKEVETK